MKTQNLLFVMTDGLRWQEVFQGADDALLDAISSPRKAAAALKAYGQGGPERRRAALMPFVWSTLAKNGQIFGNRRKGSACRVTNGRNFSYPGYSETLCGFVDPRIDSNAKRPNPNVTVLEWLHQRPGFGGKVAALGAWDVIPFILNAERCGFPVNGGFDPLNLPRPSATLQLLNRLKAEIPRKWDGEPYDALTHHTALEYLHARKPRALYVSLGETDEWAHEGDYAEYLDSARRVDDCLRELWETVQRMPGYRGRTSLVFTVDHGRGDTLDGWKSHGANVAGSEATWAMFMGPDTAPRGERTHVAPIGQNQLAATAAALLGEDYRAAVPQAGAAIAEVLAP